MQSSQGGSLEGMFMAARGGCSSVGQTLCESLACETKGIMDCTAQSQIFMISIELQHVGSQEDEQLKVLNPYFVFSWAET